ncbi:ribosome hibernation-promoting factor, HPF/YfiA family [Litchfieldia alkalitelluris]|uniref:ribosome hibernation-promoting factor, HPF/YfiA family n=1 Tax=Litchfieldia alkalitelluris TaxID=304268 RepID=UPI0014742E4B|nr:ribosome-associated translation inhibitor RaiA [Litchfieldia alkalitelluris]
MNLIIYGKNIQLTDSIKAYIHEKIGRIEQFFEEPIDTNVHVNVFILKNKHCVEISIPLNATFIRAEAHSNDLYQSVDIAEEKMKRQLRKYKTKINRKPRQELNLPKETHELTKPTKPQKKIIRAYQ